MSERLKASCVAVSVNCGGHNSAILISHSGGEHENYNIWQMEVENSMWIEDIFGGYPEPPDNPGFYVWEGEIEPVLEDQPIYYGEWREATKEDMAGLIKDHPSPQALKGKSINSGD